MGLFAIFLLGAALSLDTFAVALSLGLCARDIPAWMKLRYYGIVGLYHVVMTLVGWSVGASVLSLVKAYDHWIAFLLLAFVGGKMIQESLAGKQAEDGDACRHLSFRRSMAFGFALSIDAVVSGFSLAMVRIHLVNAWGAFPNILAAALLIGAIAFLATYLGMLIGTRTGGKIGNKAEIIGGLVLIGLGVKILVTHLSE